MITVFNCGQKKDHECDSDGEERAIKDGDGNICGATVTCSRCGASPLDDLFGDHNIWPGSPEWNEAFEKEKK